MVMTIYFLLLLFDGDDDNDDVQVDAVDAYLEDESGDQVGYDDADDVGDFDGCDKPLIATFAALAVMSRRQCFYLRDSCLYRRNELCQRQGVEAPATSYN